MNSTHDTKMFDAQRELQVAIRLTVLLLISLTVVKAIGPLPIPLLGTAGFALVTFAQFYMPIWRCDQHGVDLAAIGLHTRAYKSDLKRVALLCLIFFPPYAVAHHFYMTQARTWITDLGLVNLAAWLPQAQFAPDIPYDVAGWFAALLWFGNIVLTHSLGVALPEELFYRGYLQPLLQAKWPPAARVFGVYLGKAAIVTALLFAMGHYLGEWNPWRFGPFFPALIFAWQRNATGSILGATVFHALCNILGELLFVLYQPATSAAEF